MKYYIATVTEFHTVKHDSQSDCPWSEGTKRLLRRDDGLFEEWSWYYISDKDRLGRYPIPHAWGIAAKGSAVDERYYTFKEININQIEFYKVLGDWPDERVFDRS